RPAPEGYSRRRQQFVNPALAADTRLAALTDGKGSVHLWEPATGKVVHRINEPPAEDSAYCFSPDGKMMAVWHTDNTIRLWYTGTGKLLRPLPLPDPHSIAYPRAFSPDGHILAVPISTVENRSICLCETATGKELRRLAWQ